MQVGFAARPRAGEQESGDLHLVLPGPDRTLVAVMDGVGHGAEAALAARAASATVKRHSSESLPELFRRCHEGLLKTRGVVMLLASFQPGRLAWLGVGNIEGFLVGAAGSREFLLSAQGIVGYRLPAGLRERELPLGPADLAVFATDGVSNLGDFPYGDEPQRVADTVLARGNLRPDDVLVVAARLA